MHSWFQEIIKNNESYSYKIIRLIEDIASVNKIINRIVEDCRFIQFDSKRFYGQVNNISGE